MPRKTAEKSMVAINGILRPLPNTGIFSLSDFVVSSSEHPRTASRHRIQGQLAMSFGYGTAVIDPALLRLSSNRPALGPASTTLHNWDSLRQHGTPKSAFSHLQHARQLVVGTMFHPPQAKLARKSQPGSLPLALPELRRCLAFQVVSN